MYMPAFTSHIYILTSTPKHLFNKLLIKLYLKCYSIDFFSDDQIGENSFCDFCVSHIFNC